MKGYKGFDKDFKCLGKQYAENTLFEENGTNICEEGMMHFCENPMDVLDYYGFVDENGNLNTFAEVEADENVVSKENKRATTKLKIGAKLEFKGFVKACIDFVLEKTKLTEEDCINDSGEKEKQICSSGNYAQIGSSGNYAQIGSSGDSAKIGSSGDYAKISSSGEDSVVMCAGVNSCAKAKKGSWITLAEWTYSKKKGRLIPIFVKTEKVDGEKIKEDVFYKLENGEFVELK